MFFNSDDFGKALIVILIIAGFIGWGLIEFILYLFSHVSISWN